MTIPCAQLRVFVPRDTLEERDADRWTRRVGRSAARALEQEVARARLVGRRAGVDDATVMIRRMEDQVFLCPVQHDLRCALALRQLQAEVPPSVVRSLVADAGLVDHLELVAAAGRRPMTIDAPWAVPLPWFALFDPRDRRFTDPPEGAGPRLVHLTTVARAVPRLTRVIDVVDERMADAEELLESVADLAEWVDAFDPRSLLELDYGGLAPWLGADSLARDRSVEDLWSAVDALERGEVVEAAVHHAALRRRWRPSMSVVGSS